MKTTIDYAGLTLVLDLADSDASWLPAVREWTRVHGCDRCRHAWAAHGRSGCVIVQQGGGSDRKCGCNAERKREAA